MVFGVSQAEALDQLLRAAARMEIMPRFRKLGAGAVRAKSGPLDMVTEADIAAERMVTRSLNRLYPNALVVGEEASEHDPSLLAGLADAELAFVVDPVDGTSNFIAGLPLFGSMAAVVIRGETVAAIIHDPVLDTSSLAVRGEGAWELDADGGREDLQVARPVPVEEMTGAASWRYLPLDLRHTVVRNLDKVAQVWDFRCAAHQHRMNAAGKCHFMMFYRLMPWDHLPGVLLHAEAGGYSARFDGSPYKPGMTDGGLLCTPDRESYETLREALLK